MARLQDLYKNEVAKELMKKFEYKNVMEIPKIEKVTINIGAGDSKDNSKLLDAAVSELAIIAGQQPIITKAKKSRRYIHDLQGILWKTIICSWYGNYETSSPWWGQ